MHQPSARNVPLDYLRAFTVLLVVAHHSALAYMPFTPPLPAALSDNTWWQAFPVVDAHRSALLSLLVGFNDIFFMSLLFLLSGVFVAASYGRKGFWGFTGGRLLRLGVPFVLSAVLLAPLAYLPTYLQISPDGALTDYVRQWIALPAQSAGPAWFLWVLLVFDLAAALLFVLAPGWAKAVGRLGASADKRPFRFFLIFVILSALAYTPLLWIFGTENWFQFGPFAVQSSRIAHYVLYFIVGVGLGTLGAAKGLFDPEGNLARRWWLWTTLCPLFYALAITVLLMARAAKGQPPLLWNLSGGAAFALSCAASSLALIAVLLRFVHRARRLLDNLARSSYGIYIVHYVFVNWLLYLLLPAGLSAGVKFAIVFVGGALLSWITANLLRRIPGLARII